MSPPPPAFLADVYRYLPFLVIHTTVDGTVLHCNPATLRTTGYEEGELLGKNLWAILFPGKLFAQVPKFISLIQPAALLRDVPMTIRTKRGDERVIAFTRHVHGGGGMGNDASDTAGGARSFICIGVDLTDRLLDADRDQLPEHEFLAPELAGSESESEAGGGVVPFGPHIGNAGTVDGEVVTPIAITPRSPRGGGAGAEGGGNAGGCASIEQVREGMSRVETHMTCVRAAAEAGEIRVIQAVAEAFRQRHIATEKLSFLTRGEWLHAELHGKTVGSIRARVDELLTLYRPELG